MDRNPDPYRALGILRGATDAQVKAAHRRLAKRFHPDAPEGDHDRFLAIQEAYSLLSDPLRRRDWDAQHTSGPVRAGDPGPRRGGRGAGTPRPAREAGSAGPRRGGGRSGAAANEATGRGSSSGAPRSGQPGSGSAGSGARHGGTGEAERAGGAWSASDRDPSSRSTTWSASGVPWWEDFSPRDRGAGSAGAGAAGPAGGKGGAHGARAAGSGASGAPGAASGSGADRDAAAGAAGAGTPSGAAGTGGQRTTAHRSPEDVDVYSRSSGAAWSMAARRYFRKGEAELPKGGAWTYRGTQVVTGAEARKVNEEEAARKRAADALLRSRGAGAAPPRTAFGHEGTSEAPSGSAARPRSGGRPATGTSSAGPAKGPAPTAAAPAAATPGASGPTAPPSTTAPTSSPAPADASLVRRVRRALGLGG